MIRTKNNILLYDDHYVQSLDVYNYRDEYLFTKKAVECCVFNFKQSSDCCSGRLLYRDFFSIDDGGFYMNGDNYKFKSKTCKSECINLFAHENAIELYCQISNIIVGIFDIRKKLIIQFIKTARNIIIFGGIIFPQTELITPLGKNYKISEYVISYWSYFLRRYFNYDNFSIRGHVFQTRKIFSFYLLILKRLPLPRLIQIIILEYFLHNEFFRFLSSDENLYKHF